MKLALYKVLPTLFMSYVSAHRRASPTDLKSFNHQKTTPGCPAKLCQANALDMHIKYLQISKLDANCLQILIFHKLKPSTHRQLRQGMDREEERKREGERGNLGPCTCPVQCPAGKPESEGQE